MAKISVIIPVYNVSKYVERCARSLFEQTMQDLEFIFVDDCSPDNSIDIIKTVLADYPDRKGCVHFCRHNENKGLPLARKTGFERASGDFIAHCDSDDWVDSNMYLALYTIANKEDADIVYCDFYKSNGINHRNIQVPDYKGGLLQGPVWNKIVRRELYDNIIFPEANKAEDGAIMTQLSFFAKRVFTVHTPLYFYFDNPNSICQLPSREACVKRWRQECINTDLRVDFLNSHHASEQFHNDIIMMKYYALTNLIPYLKDDSIFQLWKSRYAEISKEMGFFSSIPLRIRISYLFMRLRFVNILIFIRK